MRVRRSFRRAEAVCICAAVLMICGQPDRGLAEDSVEARAEVRKADLERHVAFLASDTLEGRDAGSRGGAAACQYLVSELKKYGLQPAGDDGRFTQDFVPNYRNVLGLLPARGDDATEDVVLIGAHYDHVGYGRRGNSAGPVGYIHNGADDNASGTSAVLEIAEALAASDGPRRCSVLFAFWDAEEINLNGSEHWCAQPTIPLPRIRLALNVDMVGRLSERGAEVHGARTAAGLRARLARSNAASDVFLKFKDDHVRNSDHYSFLQRRLPYLMVDTGEHADYHRPTDDVERLNFDGLQRMTKLLLNVMLASTQESTPPFRKACLNEARRSRGPALAQQRLGISWSGESSDQPFRITTVLSGSAAARAGLRAGDVLLKFGDLTPANTRTLRDAVAAAENPVTLVVQRPGRDEPLSLEVKLDGPPVPWGYAITIDDAEPDCQTVTAVVPGSAAAAADLRPGDRILEQEFVPAGGSGGDADPEARELRLLIERDGRLSSRTLSGG